MKEIYVVNCCRTAVGSFGGSLKDTPGGRTPCARENSPKICRLPVDFLGDNVYNFPVW